MNIAHTAFYMLAAYCFYWLLVKGGLGFAAAAVVSVVAVTLLAVLCYRLVIEPVREHEAAVLIATIALALIFQELMLFSFGGHYLGIPSTLEGGVRLLGVSIPYQRLLILVVAAAMLAIVWFVLKRMRLGYEARAVGASVGSAQAGGISIGSVQIKLFILSGALAGLVGMQQLLADKGYLPVQYEAALGFTGIAVAFLGQNSPLGIVLAAVLWGVLARGETAVQIDTDVPREFVIILQGILIISVVVTYQLAQRRLLARQLRKAAAVEEIGDPAAAVDVEGLAKEDR